MRNPLLLVEASMLLKVVSLLALAATLTAAAPGRSPYAPASSSYHSGSATVTSYNRRGPAPSSDSYANKPAIYGTSYNSAPVAAPHYQRAPVSYAPAPAPVSYAPAPAPVNYSPHRQGAAYSGPAPAYAGYGPQTNAYSAVSQQLSHDPEYDAAKDPVSQYAAYVPVKEYGGSKPISSGNELSLYGYRK